MTHGALQVPSRDRTPTLGVRVNAGEVAAGALYSDRAAALGRAGLHEHRSRRRREQIQKRSSVAPDRRRRPARGALLTPLPSVSGDLVGRRTASPKASVQGRTARGWRSRPRFAPSSHPARATFPASPWTCRGSAERGRTVDDARSGSTDPAGRPGESALTPCRRDRWVRRRRRGRDTSPRMAWAGGNSLCVSTMTAQLRVCNERAAAAGGRPHVPRWMKASRSRTRSRWPRRAATSSA